MFQIVLDNDLLSVELIPGKNISKIFESSEGIVLFVIPNLIDVISEIELKYIHDHYNQFKKMKWEIAIITVDTQDQIDLFKSRNKPPFIIYKDEKSTFSRSIGVLENDEIPLRRTLIIDNKQTIRRVFKQILPKEHPQEIIKWIELNNHQAMTILHNGADNKKQEI